MFKSATFFTLVLPENFEASSAQLSAYVPAGATQEKSVGWIPPRRQENGALFEVVGGELILSLMIETRSVPSSALRREVDAKAREIEESTGRKPGKKERRAIEEDALLTLLPKAFPKQTIVTGWINRKDRLLVVDTHSQGKIDEFITELIKAVPGLSVSLVQTAQSPQASMTQWLLSTDPEEWPPQLCVERECCLKSSGDDVATVKFANHQLATEDVRKHVKEGKLPIELAMSWDGRVAFVLTETLKLKKIKFLDGAIDAGPNDDAGEDRFDADVTLATGLLRPMVNDIIESLGGIYQQ